MKEMITYRLKIENPHQHEVSVETIVKTSADSNFTDFFMPSWSPGSYLMREYGRLVRQVRVVDESGGEYYFEQVDKGTWRVFRNKDGFSKSTIINFSYTIYCHELTVRTSHVDRNHAFLHGPSIFVGVKRDLDKPVRLELSFPQTWNKISTGLKDISTSRGEFIYTAENYDDFIDCPIEIGTHDTDGFKVDGKSHELAFYGTNLPHNNKVKDDIKTIVEYISNYMGGMPYDRYVFITHLVPGLYGGLEHKNSTALQFNSLNFANREDYINWLCLVSHEYFHTWNVKRIRPNTFGLLIIKMR